MIDSGSSTTQADVQELADEQQRTQGIKVSDLATMVTSLPNPGI